LFLLEWAPSLKKKKRNKKTLLSCRFFFIVSTLSSKERPFCFVFLSRFLRTHILLLFTLSPFSCKIINVFFFCDIYSFRVNLSLLDFSPKHQLEILKEKKTKKWSQQQIVFFLQLSINRLFFSFVLLDGIMCSWKSLEVVQFVLEKKTVGRTKKSGGEKDKQN